MILYFVFSLCCNLILISAAGPCSQNSGYIVTQVTDPVDLAEGPHWDVQNGVLYYVSILEGQVHRYDPTVGTHYNVTLEKTVGFVVPVHNAENIFFTSQDTTIVLLYWNWTSGYRRVCPVTEVECDKPGNRFNEGKADSCGRLWAGTIGPQVNTSSLAVPEQAALYRLDDDDGSWVATTQIEKATVSNGMIWSVDNKLFYWIDSPTRKVFMFDYDITSGTISNRRTAFVLGEEYDGIPDGMTIDTEGMLWIAIAGDYQVIQVDPRVGQVLRCVSIPTKRPSSVAWGGSALDELYVTTVRHRLTEAELRAQPQAGAVFKVTGLVARGLPANEVQGHFVCGDRGE